MRTVLTGAVTRIRFCLKIEIFRASDHRRPLLNWCQLKNHKKENTKMLKKMVVGRLRIATHFILLDLD